MVLLAPPETSEAIYTGYPSVSLKKVQTVLRRVISTVALKANGLLELEQSLNCRPFPHDMQTVTAVILPPKWGSIKVLLNIEFL